MSVWCRFMRSSWPNPTCALHTTLIELHLLINPQLHSSHPPLHPKKNTTHFFKRKPLERHILEAARPPNPRLLVSSSQPPLPSPWALSRQMPPTEPGGPALRRWRRDGGTSPSELDRRDLSNWRSLTGDTMRSGVCFSGDQDHLVVVFFSFNI